MTSSAHVLIVEDHPDMRESLAQALANHPYIASITSCPDLPQAQRHLNTHTPHLLLVDLGLTSGSGLSLIRKAQTQKIPRCTAAVLTVTGKEDDLLKAIRFGAKGYLFKSDPPSQWCATVHQLLQTESPLHAAVAQAMLNVWAPTTPPAHLHPTAHQLVQHLAAGYWPQEAAQHLGLTPQQAGVHLRQVYDSFYQPEAELPPRELELLELLSRGLTFKQAAQLMGVAEPTTKTLAARVYQRLGATNLQMAIHEARQQGLLA